MDYRAEPACKLGDVCSSSYSLQSGDHFDFVVLQTSESIWDCLKEEVGEYSFKSSFFDITVSSVSLLILPACNVDSKITVFFFSSQLLAFFRFLCLQVGYAAFRLRHWWVVAVSWIVLALIRFLDLFLFGYVSQLWFSLQGTTLVTTVFLVAKVIISNVSLHLPLLDFYTFLCLEDPIISSESTSAFSLPFLTWPWIVC